MDLFGSFTVLYRGKISMQYRYIALEAVVLLLLYTLKIIQDILVLWFVVFKKSI